MQSIAGRKVVLSCFSPSLSLFLCFCHIFNLSLVIKCILYTLRHNGVQFLFQKINVSFSWCARVLNIFIHRFYESFENHWSMLAEFLTLSLSPTHNNYMLLICKLFQFAWNRWFSLLLLEMLCGFLFFPLCHLCSLKLVHRTDHIQAHHTITQNPFSECVFFSLSSFILVYHFKSNGIAECEITFELVYQ